MQYRFRMEDATASDAIAARSRPPTLQNSDGACYHKNSYT